jgi:hypothetical protein
MKNKLSIISVILVGTFNTFYAQKESKNTTNLTINDVYTANELMYYGLDFSNFRLVEPDRINEGADIKNIEFPAWNAFVLNEITMKKMAKWFKKSNIVYNPTAVTIVNTRVSEKNVVARLPFHAELDDIKTTIANYEKPSNHNVKIGMVVCVEYFQKKPREAAAYFIFFDIENGAIISSERLTTKDVSDGKGITDYWGQSCTFFIKNYVDNIYSKGL